MSERERHKEEVLQEESPDSPGAEEAATGEPRYVVGIGASAGGLEALRTLFSSMGSASRMALVVVQHLAPQHRSRLVEILAHSTSLPVKEVEEGERPAPNTIYITPPNADVVIERGVLRLSPPEATVGPKPSIDRFFRSLAEEFGEAAIGVILSGTGSDGSNGIRAIKAAGGITICQSIASAKYDGMPRAAKATRAVDFENSPEEIAGHLRLLSELAGTIDSGGTGAALTEVSREPYEEILSRLEQVSRVNFRLYKQSTVRRRIERRMITNRCSNLGEYASFLRQHPEEAIALFQDILISVTSFFRDEAAFRALARHLEERVRSKRTGQAFRCWIVGCATGEEAYSLAFLVLEAMEVTGKRLDLQIFATDIDEEAMANARKGCFSRPVVADIPPHWREKYLDEEADSFRVKDFVRERVVFARHDVTQDPPFLKLDLLSCRNVLIYFNSELQSQVFRTFHFALDDGALLFLGKSETTAVVGDLFEVTDKTAKIFTRNQRKGEIPRPHSRQELNREVQLFAHDRETTSSMELFHSVVAAFAPDSLLLDPDGRLKHTFGGANRYLNLPRGAPTVAVAKLLSPEMALDASTLMHRAQKTERPATGTQKHEVVVGQEVRHVQLSVVPIHNEGRDSFILSFLQVTAEAPRRRMPSTELTGLSTEEKVRHLEEELIATREHLQTIIEEHETANEELQALNEELQSANEELQSTNEELETTNEELQSTNEELTTLNQEINVKSAELFALNQRYQAVQGAIGYPLLVVDRNYRLVDFNPASRYLLRVSDIERGRPLRSLDVPDDFRPVLTLVDECLSAGRDGKRQLNVGERSYEISVQTYRGSDESVDGAVVSFVENTELIRALESAREHRSQLATILENTPALVTMKDATGVYRYANQRFCVTTGLALEEVLGRTDEEVFGAEVGGRVREHDFEVLKRRAALRDEQLTRIHGQERHWLASKFPLLDDQRRAHSVCTVALDITDRVQHERQLEVFRGVISSSTGGLVIFEENDSECRATFVSEEFSRLVGRPLEGVIGLPVVDVVRPLLKQVTDAEAKEIADRIATRPAQVLTVNVGSEGEENWVELRSARISRSGPRPAHLVLIAFDVNEKVRTQKLLQDQQDELQRFSKLAALGQVAAGISHEINTPLNVIRTKTQLLQRMAARHALDGARVDDAVHDIDAMVTNISHVISGLMSLARMETEERRPHDLVALVREAVHICDFALRRAGVRLSMSTPDHPVLVECFPVQIVQIVINLLNNAVDAVCERRERWVEVDITESGGRARVRVTDSGNGIDPSIAEKIMTPFFSTKKERQGTGLGLSLSRSIAREHDGELVLDSAAKNTSFVLELGALAQEGAA